MSSLLGRVGGWLRAYLFVGQMYAAMPLLAVVFTPWALVDRRGAYAGIRTYCRWVRFSAHWIVGLHSEVRGPVPTGEVLIASKHQSFFDILILCSVLERPKFIMKRELLWAPILGWYARRIGCVPVDRGKRRAAVTQMLQDVQAGRALPGQLIIYPQGTRVAPRVEAPYKTGAGALYEALGQVCVPAATNVGLFWPRKGMRRTPGLAVVEFLPPVPPGHPPQAFMAALERDVEAASDRLMDEAEGHRAAFSATGTP